LPRDWKSSLGDHLPSSHCRRPSGNLQGNTGPRERTCPPAIPALPNRDYRSGFGLALR
jgi:hypothetical protein